MTVLLVLSLVLGVPCAVVAVMLARAASVLDEQDDEELERYRQLRVSDIAPAAAEREPLRRAAGDG